VQETEIYRHARAKARRTLSYRLYRRERRIISNARQRLLTGTELARLAAIRSEIQARRAGHRRARSLPRLRRA
jgi:hypothetical protein